MISLIPLFAACLALLSAGSSSTASRFAVTVSPSELRYAIEAGETRPQVLLPKLLIGPDVSSSAQPSQQNQWTWFSTTGDPANQYPWVYTVPNSGILGDEPVTVDIAFNTSALPANEYSEIVRFGVYGSSHFAYITVNLTVNAVKTGDCTAIKDCFSCVNIAAGNKCAWCADPTPSKQSCIFKPVSAAKCSSIYVADRFSKCPYFADGNCTALNSILAGSSSSSIAEQTVQIKLQQNEEQNHENIAGNSIQADAVSTSSSSTTAALANSCNQGECNDATGLCECARTPTGGYFGQNCTVPCFSDATCSGHGSCTANGVCTCDAGFSGKSCEKKACPVGEDGVCNLAGDCDTDTGLCECEEGAFGPACQCVVQLCNGGTCDADLGTCVCPDGQFGANCEKTCSRNAQCGGHGDCEIDAEFLSFQCKCDDNFYGSNCSVSCSAESNCSSNGACSTFDGTCVCSAGFTGSDCSVVVVDNRSSWDKIRVIDWFGIVVGTAVGLLIIAIVSLSFSGVGPHQSSQNQKSQQAAK